MLMKIFVYSYSLVNITVIPVHLYYFTFCFKFYYPIVNIIVIHRYLVFHGSRKTNTKCCGKNEKNPKWNHVGVASKICSYKYCCI